MSSTILDRRRGPWGGGENLENGARVKDWKSVNKESRGDTDLKEKGNNGFYIGRNYMA